MAGLMRKRLINKQGKAEVKGADGLGASWIPRAEAVQHRGLPQFVPWLACAMLIFALLYGSSYMALLTLPAETAVDTRSQLAIDYSSWSFLAFQPVDPAIIEDIRQERELPEQIVVPGTLWPEPTSSHLQSPDIQEQPTQLAPAPDQPQPTLPQIISSEPVPNSTASQPGSQSTPTPNKQSPTGIPNETQAPQEAPKPTEPPQSVEPPQPAETREPEEPPEPADSPEPDEDPKKPKPPVPTRNPKYTEP